MYSCERRSLAVQNDIMYRIVLCLSFRDSQKRGSQPLPPRVLIQNGSHLSQEMRVEISGKKRFPGLMALQQNIIDPFLISRIKIFVDSWAGINMIATLLKLALTPLPVVPYLNAFTQSSSNHKTYTRQWA